jgi:quercetin dioxygenase-like cupin family protein
VTDLAELAGGALVAAHESAHGRFSTLLTGGSGHSLRQVVMALVDGQSLHDHESPGEATLQVLHGQVRLHAGETEIALSTGQWTVIPPVRHGVEALTDAVILLTVAKDRAAPPVASPR